MRIFFFIFATFSLFVPGIAHADLATANNAYAQGNFQTAFQEFQALAEKGDGFAQNRLGMLYRDGKGTEQDHKAATIWFQKAAEDGAISAYGNLGQAYEEGIGVAQDYVLAFKWYYLGQSLTKNAIALRRLKSKMSPLQTSEAKQLARDLLQTRRPSSGGVLPALRL